MDAFPLSCLSNAIVLTQERVNISERDPLPRAHGWLGGQDQALPKERQLDSVNQMTAVQQNKNLKSWNKIIRTLLIQRNTVVDLVDVPIPSR